MVLAVTHTLGVQALENASAVEAAAGAPGDGNGGPGGTPTHGGGKNGAAAPPETKVQYTVWITEAWRVLGWAEPSAALFWEMATMYHTLHVAGRSIEIEETEVAAEDDDDDQMSGIHRTLSQSIPPILSCGSSTSFDSSGGGGANSGKKEERTRGGREPDSPSSIGSGGGGDTGGFKSSPGKKSNSDKAKSSSSSQNMKASAASAKELPVWLVGMFLLLHCEEQAFRRNVSGEDERRFDALMAKQNGGSGVAGEIWKEGLGGKGMDFGTLLSLSPRTQIHLDDTNCTCYLLRHLRKFLLLCAVPHNPDALSAINYLVETTSPHDSEYTDRQDPTRSHSNQHSTTDADILLSRHDEEHVDVGLNIRLTSDDLERLNLVIQAPSGGLIDDPPLYISEVMPTEDIALYGGMTLEEVENEIRRHLEMGLLHVNNEDLSVQQQQHEEKEDAVEVAMKEMGKLALNNETKKDDKDSDNNHKPSKMKARAASGVDDYHKELSYTKLRGTTILLKPNSHPDNNLQEQRQPPFPRPPTNNNNISTITTEPPPTAPSLPNNGRLHDVHVTDCSDAHIYLLQPFEHATISACTNCTIVVGAVAGLLHMVDCERIKITSAARRVLISNCFDVSHFIFTPSPCLLVGDNRSCQFAPYNTYYDGLREDLLATGLAGAVISQDNTVVGDSVHGPALQCASNKWKQPVELAKLSELPHPPGAPGADDRAVNVTGSGEDAMKTPTLVPASEFQVLFVPLESDANRQRRMTPPGVGGGEDGERFGEDSSIMSGSGGSIGPKVGIGSQYSHSLADVLQLSPFRLPTEYERRAIVKAERMKSLQQAIQTDLSPEQQVKLEEELNRGFRDWLVTSGNLRQVLDLVHLESRGAI